MNIVKEVRRKKLAGILIAFNMLVLLLGALALVFGKEAYTAHLAGELCMLNFSKESGFYTEAFSLEVKPYKAGSIYYTFDGSEPDLDSENTLQYTKPIDMPIGDTERVWNLRFKEYFADGSQSETYTVTYIIGTNVDKRYHTLVMNIVTDLDNLYGYENGIFVEGKLRDDYIKTHPDEEENGDMPANYNVHGKVSERPVHVDIFESDGANVISQEAGIRTSGGVTRQANQKSFKLYARDEYDSIDYFPYAFFQDACSEADGTVNAKYECLKVRNTGNDRLSAFIRDELGMRLAKQAGLQDVQSVTPAAVYINGLYAGLYWMHETYDDSYFKQKYGSYDGDMVVIGDAETEMETDTEDAEENEYAREYNELYAKYSRMDLTDDKTYKELCDKIDIDNYIRYFAVECYMGNLDWPANNQRVYRYAAGNGEKYRENTVFDGRYRYLIYDVDSSMGFGRELEDMDDYNVYEKMCYVIEHDAPLMKALLQREDVKSAFAAYVCDLMNDSFSYADVTAALTELEKEREQEMQYFITISNADDSYTNIDEAYMEEQLQVIDKWAQKAPSDLLDGIESEWNVGDKYDLVLNMPEGTYAHINTTRVEAPGTEAVYFSDLDVTLTSDIPEGRKIAYWRINGTKYYGSSVSIKKEMMKNGKVYVSMYVRDDSNAGLMITKVKSAGDSDYFYIYNPTLHPILTKDYYVKDKEKPSHVYYLPEKIMAPGEEVRINCANCLEDEINILMQVGFSVSSGERLILENKVSGNRSQVEIPHFGNAESIYIKDAASGEWFERKIEKPQEIRYHRTIDKLAVYE